MTRCLLAILLTLMWYGTCHAAEAPAQNNMTFDCYVSTGDNHWLGLSLPIDTPAAIEASFDLMKDIGVRRVYWRGLEAATWVEGHHVVRPENCRYYSFWKWLRHLYAEVEPDRLAVEAARKRGMEIWGVATLVDWGSQADVPPFNEYPFNSESSLRIDHPEWVPVDRYGVLRQGGPISFAYPEARKALVDLHMKFMNRDKYDGMIFLTYAENHSMRFQDEFGYNEPIVEEFKRRHKIDIRFEDWTRFASRFDWYKLRGEYLTEYLRELKTELDKNDQKLGVVLQSWEPHFTQPWNVPELMHTAGHIYQDLETWVREEIVDEFEVYGYCDPHMQERALQNLLWMTRDTKTSISLITSNPTVPLWEPVREQGAFPIAAWGEDAMHIDRAGLALQPIEALRSERTLDRMKVLSQIIYKKTHAEVEQVAPLVRDPNLIVRRMALAALGEMKDAEGVPFIEQALNDPELTVRYAAMGALRHNHRPESLAASVATLDATPIHPMAELARNYWLTAGTQRGEFVRLMREHDNPVVRSTAARALSHIATPDMVADLVAALEDSDRFTRFAAARALGGIRDCPPAAEALIAALRYGDCVVNNRAATSLGDIVSRQDSATTDMQGRMLAALIDLYRQSGDDSTRDDIDWGYRPVGEAILCFGEAGEAALRDMMEQDADERLAVHAWKTLYIRKSPGSFSEVNEEQNEQAMRMRPASLRTREFARLSTTWDKDPAILPEATGMLGNVNQSTGRWGSFSPSGPAITTEQAHSGQQSIKLIRGGGALTGSVIGGIDAGVTHQVRLWCYRESNDSGFILSVKGYEGAYRQEMALYVDEAGRLHLAGGQASGWVDAKLTVPAERWCQLRMIADASSGNIRVVLHDASDEQVSDVRLPLAKVKDIRLLTFSPQGKTGSSVYLDDIELVEMP